MQSKSYGEIGPLQLVHEDRYNEEKQAILAAFNRLDKLDADDISDALAAIADPPPWVSSVGTAIIKSVQNQGRKCWSIAELTDLVERKAAHHRAYGYQRNVGIPVMSVHQAKNRQFDHVVLLWPPGVGGSNEQKARLLYNGMTRAVRSCSVFVRTEAQLAKPPFHIALSG